MSTGATMESFHVDETACGPLCQHPQCWASNRRVERGLPRVSESLSARTGNDNEGALPTVKVFNLLDEYGENPEDRYPSRSMGKDNRTPSHMRSASAPNILAPANTNARSPVFAPITPYTSPLGVRGGSFRSTKSAGRTSTRSRAKTSPKITRVEVEEMLCDLQPPPSAGTSSFYVWYQSKKSREKRKKSQKENPISTSMEPMTVHPKDLTNDMVPDIIEKKRITPKHQKGKRLNHETPTGGRPYTHPARSPPPTTRRTLPQDIDDGIHQLLSLPRDVLLEVLDHIKKSDMLDKNKVQLLLSTIMPHIHFQPETPSPTTMMQPSVVTPLMDSGILQNRKVTLHDVQQKPYDRHEFPNQNPPGKMPQFLDDAVISRMASSAYDTMIEEAESLQRAEEEEEIELSTAGRMTRMRPLGPIRATIPGNTEPVYRLTSVSAKGLPPLKPGVRHTKPFDYTKSGPSLDLTLGPLPQPKRASPDRAPPTPYSLNASTLHVTMPSVPSPDRTLNTTPAMLSYGKSPIPPLPKSNYERSSPSPLPSEDFPELHWYDADIVEHPLHALSPSMSTRVPKAPQGTPATALRQHLYTRESLPSKILPGHPEDSLETSSSPTPQPPINRTEATDTLGMGTIPETASTYPGTETMTGFNSRSGFLQTPSKQPVSSVTPNGFNESYTEQDCETLPGSITSMTPAPMSTTPEIWPNVDERDFLRTPETTAQTRLSAKRTEMPAPVAPPPSPEPRDANDDFEFLVNKSTVTSLTPLAEEEEDLDEKEKVGDDADAKNTHTEKSVTFEGDTTNGPSIGEADVTAGDRPKGDVQADETSDKKDTESPQEDKTCSEADKLGSSVSIKEEENNTDPNLPDTDQNTSQPGADSATFITQSDDVTGTDVLNTQNNDVTDPATTSAQNEDVTNSNNVNIASTSVQNDDVTNANNVNIDTSKSDDIPNSSSSVNDITSKSDNITLKNEDVESSDEVNVPLSQSDPDSTTIASLPSNNDNTTISDNTNANNSGGEIKKSDVLEKNIISGVSEEDTTDHKNNPVSNQQVDKTMDESMGVVKHELMDRTVDHDKINIINDERGSADI